MIVIAEMVVLSSTLIAFYVMDTFDQIVFSAVFVVFPLDEFQVAGRGPSTTHRRGMLAVPPAEGRGVASIPSPSVQAGK